MNTVKKSMMLTVFFLSFAVIAITMLGITGSAEAQPTAKQKKKITKELKSLSRQLELLDKDWKRFVQTVNARKDDYDQIKENIDEISRKFSGNLTTKDQMLEDLNKQLRKIKKRFKKIEPQYLNWQDLSKSAKNTLVGTIKQAKKIP